MSAAAGDDPARFLQAPPDRPVLRLVLADPAGAAAGPLTAALGPELAVEPAGPDPAAAGAGRWPGLPWALLALAAPGPDGAAVLADAVRAVREAAGAGRPPAALLLCPAPDTAPPEEAALAEGPLPCPVVVLARGGAGASAGAAAWRRAAPEAFVLRLLGADGWSGADGAAETARTVKEELRVWPA
ncbi:hypothetical protein ACFVFS_35095 [Kitasatospora sp. NPDC057692]|uniref:hypothetical protein n=1 Tax=Kitasatospora sp. NPDC057692 TaxID=3346215 RepID=UPI0036897F1F